MANETVPPNIVDIRADKDDFDGKSDESASSKQTTVTITKSKVIFWSR